MRTAAIRGAKKLTRAPRNGRDTQKASAAKLRKSKMVEVSYEELVNYHISREPEGATCQEFIHDKKRRMREEGDERNFNEDAVSGKYDNLARSGVLSTRGERRKNPGSGHKATVWHYADKKEYPFQRELAPLDAPSPHALLEDEDVRAALNANPKTARRLAKYDQEQMWNLYKHKGSIWFMKRFDSKGRRLNKDD